MESDAVRSQSGFFFADYLPVEFDYFLIIILMHFLCYSCYHSLSLHKSVTLTRCAPKIIQNFCCCPYFDSLIIIFVNIANPEFLFTANYPFTAVWCLLHLGFDARLKDPVLSSSSRSFSQLVVIQRDPHPVVILFGLFNYL